MDDRLTFALNFYWSLWIRANTLLTSTWTFAPSFSVAQLNWTTLRIRWTRASWDKKCHWLIPTRAGDRGKGCWTRVYNLTVDYTRVSSEDLQKSCSVQFRIKRKITHLSKLQPKFYVEDFISLPLKEKKIRYRINKFFRKLHSITFMNYTKIN